MALIPQAIAYEILNNYNCCYDCEDEYGYIFLYASCSGLFWGFLFFILKNVTSL